MKTHWQVSFTGQMSVLRQDFTNLDIECTLSLPQAAASMTCCKMSYQLHYSMVTVRLMPSFDSLYKIATKSNKEPQPVAGIQSVIMS